MYQFLRAAVTNENGCFKTPEVYSFPGQRYNIMGQAEPHAIRRE